MEVEFGKVTSIFRGYSYEQVREAALVLLEGHIVKNMEITLNSEGAFDIIKKISDEFSGRLNVGAGTVLTLEGLKRAYQAGASFVLSPDMMSEQMLTFCKENHIISVPGAYSPSEIRALFNRGADIVKVFPANELSHSYAKKVCEPLGDLPLMAVGGVNTQTVAAVFEGGYKYAGSAGGIFKKADLLTKNYAALRASLNEFESHVPSL